MDRFFETFQQLPDELIQDILERLSKPDLASLNSTCRWFSNLATPLIWREVNLVDCRTYHASEKEGEPGWLDEHDDTPLLKKLLVLVQNPRIASCVQELTHRCHLPPPAIFYELPRTPFSGQTLSPDPRTTKLVQLAVERMSHVHTLRIVFGHPNLTDALLRCFFDKQRQREVPISRLWLENCRMSAGCQLQLDDHPLGLSLQLDFAGLESIRFRRMPLRAGTSVTRPIEFGRYVHARGESFETLQDGTGGWYRTTVNDANRELHLADFGDDKPMQSFRPPPSDIHTMETLFAFTHKLDARIYEKLAEETHLPDALNNPGTIYHDLPNAYRGPWLDPKNLDIPEKNRALLQVQRERMPSADAALGLLKSASVTLTSLNLDWVFTMPEYQWRMQGTQPNMDWAKIFAQLFSLRFPHLRALQFRNAVVSETSMPSGLYLLDRAKTSFSISDELLESMGLTCLEFMEAHDNLQCLAWPMESFFSNEPLEPAIANRVVTVIDNLARSLIDLRVDTLYASGGEQMSEEFECFDSKARGRRRRFISNFASKMTKLESIKIEGGMPRDERRELVRALHACPLNKLVMIGVCCPIGNTWGVEGQELTDSVGHATNDLADLEPEHKDAVYSLGSKKPEPVPSGFKFKPSYGWPASPPMLHTIASFHAETITELKFCGYKGAPELFSPAPITTPLLLGLKAFNKLSSLIMSVWLPTGYEDQGRDHDIIRYWLDARSPSSTSLVRKVIDEEPEGWERELMTKYSPRALAWHVTNLIGPFLSDQAKARAAGVHIRASMCIGDNGGIFDLDLQVGKGPSNSDVCLEFTGPREELEPGRRKSKLENRRWF